MSLLQSPPSLIHLINAHMSVRTCSLLYIFSSSRLPPNAHTILYVHSIHFWAQPIHFNHSHSLLAPYTHFWPLSHSLAPFLAPMAHFQMPHYQPTTYICWTWNPCLNVCTWFFKLFLLSRMKAYVIPYVPFGNICKLFFTIGFILFVSNMHTNVCAYFIYFFRFCFW